MTWDDMTMLILGLFCAFNVFVFVIFLLHEKLEHYTQTRLREAVEHAVRAVEQLCATLENPEKKQEAIARVEALLGWQRWFVPALVIDTAIEAEVFLIRQMQVKLSVDHDTPTEIVRGEGSE